MEPAAKKPRRSWTREEETRLLQHYFRARNDASLRSDKGIKSKAWTLIISRLAEDGVDADKDQCRSKYSRLMSEYDAFKRLCNLSGAGWCSETNTPTLDEEGWAALAQAQPRNAALFKRFKTEGFFHDNICALLAGDSRATADDASSVRQFDAEVLLAASSSVDANNYSTTGDSATAEHETGSNEPEHVPPSPFASPTALQRTERVKRYRDGRRKAREASAAASTAADDAKASVAAFMKTAEAYFAMKMKMMARELGEGEDATV
ncbi:hypothetical protein PR003_g32765 [Phytophthora rubi]|uniref:Myb-like domain-containing protein n=1 Tax=Phytophthora rubi TaxID=129364 RepID=A0A6A3GHP5_9STRA|nr:hypothetical protein PR001_g31745 [Phytophthora rubi]KAE9264551.1 hypothetical protein PR003_g32765 [Phytophthora rubi]